MLIQPVQYLDRSDVQYKVGPLGVKMDPRLGTI